MRSCDFTIAAALGVLLVAPVAFTQDAVDEGHLPRQAIPSARNASAPGDGADGMAREAYLAASHRMHSEMTLRPGTDADVLFAQAMLPHHEGAVDMARAQLQHGNDPEMRELAEEIIAAQEGEIDALKDWLARQPAAP
ncbi:MAG TPA: DUF305 domain-containing protein [Geminicoccus sp.]|uniref:CopM family metallochaperone n=1 Tax=Geminicoccus sp. TaxID=2024832 RepID=UPI002D117D15|nr:DUF305 domain-containing protein [Geminicoccus sp.]HWL67798.1 DUF305 domain-containing protein [Geminicoccus sp.]